MVKSARKLKTFEQISSKKSFGNNDFILVEVLNASTHCEQEIACLLVKDGHPEVKIMCICKIIIVGKFPHREVPFYKGEKIILGNGSVSENDQGNEEFLFQCDQQSTVIRLDFQEENEDEFFGMCMEFLFGRRSTDNKENMENIYKWVVSGLVAATPVDKKLCEATIVNACRFNLACKVQKVLILTSNFAVISVADGTICKDPVLTMDKEKDMILPLVNESKTSADIIVTSQTVDLNHIQEGSYVRLYDVQLKKFAFKLPKSEILTVFKMDGRFFSYETLDDNFKERIMRLLRGTNGLITTDSSSGGIVNNSTVSHCDVASTEQTTPQQNANICVRNNRDDSETDIIHKNVTQKENFIHKSHNSSQILSPRQSARERQLCLEKNRNTINPKGNCVQPGASANNSINSHQNSNQTTLTNLSSISEYVESRNEVENSGAFAHSSSSEDFMVDEAHVVEKRVVLRTLKYLPGRYRVNVWIKDVCPSLLGSELDLVKVRCPDCRMERTYSTHRNQQLLADLEICSDCSKSGLPSFLAKEFHFTLILWDACDREISVVVTKENAVNFLRCSPHTYTTDEGARKRIWNTLRKLKDGGCRNYFRCAEDMVEVDIGVTVENGNKKYILVGGVLKNIVS